MRKLLALDFDGVMCNGLSEYFQTAWRTYLEIWPSPLTPLLMGVQEKFYALRPLIESGWEMPVLIHALQLHLPDVKITENWPQLAQALSQQAGLDAKSLALRIDIVRDRWIAQDLAGWLGEHRFYTGVIERLQYLDPRIQLVIISTKEGRFIRQLLDQAGLNLADDQIYGKEVKQAKSQTLRQVQQKLAITNSDTMFVEDRLQTLYAVKAEADLAGVKLYLAAWGYNTVAERAQVAMDLRIRLLTLEEFPPYD